MALKNNVAINEPDAGQRARVRVIIPSVFKINRSVRGYPNSTCTGLEIEGNGTIASSRFGFVKSRNDQSLGMPASARSLSTDVVQAEVYALANQVITLHYVVPGVESLSLGQVPGTGVWIPGCDVALTFTPEAGADYEFVFEPDFENKRAQGAGEATWCPYEAVRLTSDGSGSEAVATAVPLAVDRSGPCRPYGAGKRKAARASATPRARAD